VAVAVVITPEQDAPRLIHWAGLFGRAAETSVLVFSVVPEGEDPPPGIAAAVDRATASIESAPEFECTDIATDGVTKAVLAEVRKQDVDLLILGQRLKSKPDTDMLALFRDAPCRTVLLRPGGDRNEDAARVLVPTDRGPHASLALKLAAGLAEAAGGRATALFVQSDGGDDAELLGKKILDRRVGRAVSDDAEKIDIRVVKGRWVREIVADEAKGYDLVLAGTPDEWTARRVLFGTVQRSDLYGPEGTSVGVVRSSAPLPTRFLTALRRLVEASVPQLGRLDRVALADNLRTASRFDFDFVFFTCVSTLIAALGLIDGSTAVVIGAMLLAPLMTPLIGAGSAIVQGNVRFLFATLRSVTFGFILAVALAVVVGLVVGLDQPTAEMLSRDRPEFLDLGVAFFSGIAAAYATARPGLSATLPGVAIAASLVPPLATAGVMLTMGRPWLAVGAILLFTANITAIILGAALSLFASGIRSRHLHGRQKMWTRRVAIAALIVASIVVVWISFRLAGFAEP